MPLVTWLVYDTITPAQQMTDRIGAWINICDGGTGGPWGPVYEDLDAVGGAKYAVEFNSTLMQTANPSLPKTWTVAATLESQYNPHGIIATQGDPLFSAEDLGHLEEIEFNNFSEHDYSEPEE